MFWTEAPREAGDILRTFLIFLPNLSLNILIKYILIKKKRVFVQQTRAMEIKWFECRICNNNIFQN